MLNSKRKGTAAYDIGNISSRSISKVKQCWANQYLDGEDVRVFSVSTAVNLSIHYIHEDQAFAHNYKKTFSFLHLDWKYTYMLDQEIWKKQLTV